MGAQRDGRRARRHPPTSAQRAARALASGARAALMRAAAGRRMRAEAEAAPPTAMIALRARVALAQRDPEALAAALARLREWAPSLEQAVLGENRFRQEAGLPQVPERSIEALLAEPPPLPPAPATR
jgi:hypothetical protein